MDRVGWRAVVGTSMLGAVTLSACAGGSASNLDSFGWLRPSQPTHGWLRAEPASGGATLAYPSSFKNVKADTGAVSVAVTTGSSVYLAYMNVTPRQGSEQLNDFAAFRVDRLSDENVNVHLDAAKEAVRFVGGTGTCVVDDYMTRVGHNHYQEISCLVAGRHGTYGIVAAALTDQWTKWSAVLRQAVASFTVN